MSANSSDRIGLECPSGDFGDCFQEEKNADDILPSGCEQVLIFSQSKRTCGVNCDRERSENAKNKVIKEGWTMHIRCDLVRTYY